MENKTIFVRAMLEPYLEVDRRKGARKYDPPNLRLEQFNRVFVFDTETTVDQYKNLKFGYFEVIENGKCTKKGFVVNPDRRALLAADGKAHKIDSMHHEILTEEEHIALTEYATKNNIPIYTREHFIKDIFFINVYELGCVCVGHNLPFDLTRLATRVELTNNESPSISSFRLFFDNDGNLPAIEIKKLSNAESINFTNKGTNMKGDAYKGVFVDTAQAFSVLRSAGTSRPSLAHAGKMLEVPIQKRQIKEEQHGTVTSEYIDYAIDDVKATGGVYAELLKEFNKYGFTNMTLAQAYSGASLGKKLFDMLGIKGFTENNPNYPSPSYGRIMFTYVGGRVEVRNRHEILKTMILDFTSMYPTILCLLGLWEFVISTGYKEINATEETQQLLNDLTLEDLIDPKTWPRLVGIAKIKLNGDLLPTRTGFEDSTKNGDDGERSVCLAHMYNSEKELWFSLLDLAASKILTGKAPEIVEAIKFTPNKRQKGLKPAKILGMEVDPRKTNLIKFLVETRADKKADMEKIIKKYKVGLTTNIRYQELEAKKRSNKKLTNIETEEHKSIANGYKKLPEYLTLDGLQLALKILANALGYGIFVELITSDSEDLINVDGGISSFQASGKAEDKGKYYNPLLATLITSGARLMLAIAEAKVKSLGYQHYYMDTDSIFVPPEVAAEVASFFEPLNPYNPEFITDVLKIEDKFNIYDKKTQTCKKPMYSFRISSKRYVTFLLNEAGYPDIKNMDGRLHGLGHITNPLADELNEISEFDKEAGNEKDVVKWQSLIWKQFILLQMGEIQPHDISEAYEGKVAIGKLAIRTPTVYKRFEKMNSGKHWIDQVKPYNFFTVAFAKKPSGDEKIDNKEQKTYISPLVSKNPQDMLKEDFVIDYTTGDICNNNISNYPPLADILLDYYDKSEHKLEGSVGFLKTRSIFVDEIKFIGKELPNIDQLGVDIANNDDIQVFSIPGDKLSFVGQECNTVLSKYTHMIRTIEQAQTYTEIEPIIKANKFPAYTEKKSFDRYKTDLIKLCAGIKYKINGIRMDIKKYQHPDAVTSDVEEFARSSLVFLRTPYKPKSANLWTPTGSVKDYILTLGTHDAEKMKMIPRTLFRLKNKVKNDDGLNLNLETVKTLIGYVSKHKKAVDGKRTKGQVSD